MPVEVYLNFNGNCREAVMFYAKVFETETPQIMTFGDSPPNPDYPLPESAKELVMHTRLHINGSTVMFSDTFPGMPYVQGNNVSLSLLTQDEAKLRTWFSRLKEGGNVGMDLQETFWSKCYGNLTDRFGIEWQFNFEPNEV